MVKTLLVAAMLAAQAAAPPIFRFETDGFWLNLHHYLYVLGRAEAKIPDSGRDAVAGAPADEAEGLKRLTVAERQAWREAVTAYAASLSKLDTVFDRKLYNLTNALRRASDDRPARALQIDVAVAEALDRAAPIYRKTWWPRHRDANRAWRKGIEGPLSELGFEITFHEAMHQWDEEIDGRLRRIAREHKLKFNDLLSHAMIFHTTGEAMRTLVPSHVPYAEAAGIWKGRMGAFKPALDAHWKPHLDGQTTLDTALLALLKAG